MKSIAMKIFVGVRGSHPRLASITHPAENTGAKSRMKIGFADWNDSAVYELDPM
jgi:hypothetical protein